MLERSVAVASGRDSAVARTFGHGTDPPRRIGSGLSAARPLRAAFGGQWSKGEGVLAPDRAACHGDPGDRVAEQPVVVCHHRIGLPGLFPYKDFLVSVRYWFEQHLGTPGLLAVA